MTDLMERGGEDFGCADRVQPHNPRRRGVQIISFHSPWNLSNNGATWPIGGQQVTGNPANPSNVPWNVAGTFRDFLVRIEVAAGVGKTWTGTMYKGTGLGAASSTRVMYRPLNDKAPDAAISEEIDRRRALPVPLPRLAKMCERRLCYTSLMARIMRFS
jgi:hypothetical protein